MSGGEGGVPRRPGEEFYGSVDRKGPYPAEEGLEQQVAGNQIQRQAAGDSQPLPPCLPEGQQDRCQQNPDFPVVAEAADKGQDHVQKAVPPVGLYPVQYRQFRSLHSAPPLRRIFTGTRQLLSVC